MTQRLNDAAIDALVVGEDDDDAAWDEPVHVHRKGSLVLMLPAYLAKRAEFLAKLHREANLETWLMRVIEERVELEEGAILQAKRDLSAV